MAQLQRSSQVPIVLVTRARAKKFKDELNGLCKEVQAKATSWRPIKHGPHVQQRCINQVLEEFNRIWNYFRYDYIEIPTFPTTSYG